MELSKLFEQGEAHWMICSIHLGEYMRHSSNHY